MNGLLLKVTSYPIPFWRWLKHPLPGNFISGHFLFTEGKFNQEVVFDPGTYFTGDEVTASLRAFTAGYDIYHPHRVLGWHVYDRSTRITHWHDHSSWYKLEQKSLKIIRRLFDGSYRGAYGIGKLRTIKQYEELIFTALIKK